MAPLRLKPNPNLFKGVPTVSQPVLVATTKSFPRKNIGDQAAAFTAVVARSLEAAAKKHAAFRIGLNFSACLEEEPTRHTARGYLVAKFTIVDPAIVECLASITDLSPLLPIEKPNPGFDVINLSWENRVSKYYRSIDVPADVSVEGLITSINEAVPCKYVEPQRGPGGYVMKRQHIVEFTVSSATSIPPEFQIPNPTRGKRAYLIRVGHVPVIDHKAAKGIAGVHISEWEDVRDPPAWGSAASIPAGVIAPNRHTFSSAGRANNSAAAKASTSQAGKAGKKGPKQLDRVAQDRIKNAQAKFTGYKDKVADNDKAIAAKIIEDERAAAAAAAAAAEKLAEEAKAAAEEKEASEAYVKTFVTDSIASAVKQHAPEEAAAAAAAIKAAEVQRLQKNKRVHSDSEEDDDEEKGADTTMNEAEKSKTDPKKARETGGEDEASPMLA